MPRPKRNLHATVTSTVTPPSSLTPTQSIARITAARGSSLYTASLPSGTSLLVELEPKFRSTIWIKRGSYVVVDTGTLAERENKIDGEIVNVVRDEKEWRKTGYWPREFEKKGSVLDADSSEESRAGKMPPSSDDEEEDGDMVQV